MEPEEIERTLLSSIQTPDHLNKLRQDYRLTPRNFPYHLDEADFVWDYVLQYGEGPSKEIFQARFPEFVLAPLDNFDYIAKEFRNDHVRRAVWLFISGHEAAMEKDAETATTSLIHQLQGLQLHDESNRQVLDASNSADLRFDSYRLRADGMSKSKLSWGIDPLDNFPVNFLKGQFIGLIADTKAGKSWVALKIGLQNYFNGKKVVIISPEMTTLELQCRTDTMMAQLHGYPISNHSLLYGIPGIEENYKKYLEVMNREQLILYTSVPSDKLTVTAISSIIKADHPDLIILDGIYLMDDEEGAKESWNQIRNMCKGLKSLATETNTALVVTNQTSRTKDDNTKNAEPAKANLVAYGYDFNRYVDTLLSIGGAPIDSNTRQIAVPLIRNGRAIQKAYDITFNPDTGDVGRSVGEIPPMDINNLDW